MAQSRKKSRINYADTVAKTTQSLLYDCLAQC